MPTQIPSAWDQFWENIVSFRAELGQLRAVNVNTESLIQGAKTIVQLFFRDVRPELHSLGLDDGLEPIDGQMHELLRLSNGRNPRKSYVSLMRKTARTKSKLEIARERKLGELRSGAGAGISLEAIEQGILATLTPMLPTAAASYEQAVRDLRATDRISFRGVAVELRETLREVLDHLAPDKEVMKSEGFRLEPGHTKPTMRQKARFILRSRDQSDTAIKAPADSASLVEEYASALVRSTYERGSLSTHNAKVKGELHQLKMYTDTVLAELLAIHKG